MYVWLGLHFRNVFLQLSSALFIMSIAVSAFTESRWSCTFCPVPKLPIMHQRRMICIYTLKTLLWLVLLHFFFFFKVNCGLGLCSVQFCFATLLSWFYFIFIFFPLFWQRVLRWPFFIINYIFLVFFLYFYMRVSICVYIYIYLLEKETLFLFIASFFFLYISLFLFFITSPRRILKRRRKHN